MTHPAVGKDVGKNVGKNVGKDVLRFEWREIDGPPTQKPGRQGFGSILIRDLLAKTYRAKIQMDFDVTGLVWLLEVDVERVVTNATTVGQTAGNS